MCRSGGRVKIVETNDLVRLESEIWEIPTSFSDDMRVPARLYADESLLEDALGDRSLEQLVNTTTLPGIVKYAIAMPDIHQGYGFPIGGVVATKLPDGVIPLEAWATTSTAACASRHRKPARK